MSLGCGITAIEMRDTEEDFERYILNGIYTNGTFLFIAI